MPVDPAKPPRDETGAPHAGRVRGIGAGIFRAVRQLGVYFGLLAIAGAGLVLVGKLMRLLGLSASATHVARFAMIGLYLAAAVATARGKR